VHAFCLCNLSIELLGPAIAGGTSAGEQRIGLLCSTPRGSKLTTSHWRFSPCGKYKAASTGAERGSDKAVIVTETKAPKSTYCAGSIRS
jgi:hypothetical protein